MELIPKIKYVLTEPAAFFSKLKEKGLKEAFVFFAILSVIPAVLGNIISYFTGSSMINMMNSVFGLKEAYVQPSVGSLVGTIVFTYVLSLGVIFVGMGILHLWLMIWGAKGKYEDTFKLGVYSSTANYLFNWIPFLGFLASVYSLVTIIIGTETMCKFSRMKAILVYVIPLIVFMIIAGICAWFVFAYVLPEMAQAGITPAVVQ